MDLLLRCFAGLLPYDVWPFIWASLTECDKYILLLAYCNVKFDSRALYLCAGDGHMRLFDLFRSKFYTDRCSYEAAKGGQLTVLQKIVQCKYPVTVQAMHAAVSHRRPKCTQFLLSVTHIDTWKRDGHLPGYAACSGSTKIVEMLFRKGLNDPISISKFAENAARYNKINILRWLEANARVDISNYAKIAAREGHLDLLKEIFVIDNDIDVFDYACAGGHVEILDWLLDQDCDIGDGASHAELHGRRVLDWLLENDAYEPSPNAHWCAAIYGNIEASEWLLGHGTAIDSQVWDMTFQNEPIPYIRWLIAHKVPWGVGFIKKVFEQASKNYMLEVVRLDDPVEFWKHVFDIEVWTRVRKVVEWFAGIVPITEEIIDQLTLSKKTKMKHMAIVLLKTYL
jgi:hypothetical protein